MRYVKVINVTQEVNKSITLPTLPQAHLHSHIHTHTFTHLCTYTNTCTSEFLRAGVDLDKAMVGSCGSGVTACILAFAAHMLGKDMPVYDVSIPYSNQCSAAN